MTKIYLHGSNPATIVGDAGDDRLTAFLPVQFNLWGGGGDDRLTGGLRADTVLGGGGKDTLFGGLGADSLDGGAGADTLDGGAGNDSLDGGNGDDTAIYAGGYAGYTVTRQGDTVIITDIDTTNGNLGTDRLDHVEHLQFGDRTIDLIPLDLDVLIGNYDEANQILVNQGGLQGGSEGHFLLGDTVPGGSQDTRVVALGDLDGDGDLDALIGNQISDSQILVNQGGLQGGSEGDFLLGATVPGGGHATEAVALGDLDGDGDLDALIGNSLAENLILVNQGGLQGGTEGTFLGDTAPGGDKLTGAVALGDLDGDGDLDALIGNYNGTENQILINQGGLQGGSEGDFLLGDTVPGGGQDTFDVALGDLDGDGDLDALIGNYHDQSNQILVNQGGDQNGSEGTFLLGDTVPGGGQDTAAVALGDLDGDGDLDALIGNFGEPNQILVNQGGLQGGSEGAFLLGATVPGGSLNTFAVALGDLDGDGDLDALIGNFSDTENQILVNQGGLQGGTEGIFLLGGTVPGGSQSSISVPLGDLDGDGAAGLTPAGLPIVGPGAPLPADVDWLG